MYHDSSSIDVSDAFDLLDLSDDEQQKISVWVDHVEEKENKVAENNNIDNQRSPLVLQQTNNSIVHDRPRRKKGPHRWLIQECNIIHYALSCAKHVENDFEPATYIEAVASINPREVDFFYARGDAIV
jgi:hypothetical protein